MELIINVFLLLALSSLFSSANAICVPRNISHPSPATAPIVPPIVPPEIAQQTPPVSDTAPPPQSLSPPTNTAPPPQSPSPPANSAPPPQSPSPPTNSAPPPTDSEEASDSEETSGLPVFHKLNANDMVSSVVSSVTTDLVEICDVTSNPQLCKTSISSHMQGSTVDPVSALKTEIGESIKEVSKAIATLKVLRTDSSATDDEIACYDTCLENFDMAIEDLKAGVESIDVHDIGKMESVLTAVMTDLTTCDDTFSEMGVDSPLDNLSTKMNKYASNCLAISKLLK